MIVCLTKKAINSRRELSKTKTKQKKKKCLSHVFSCFLFYTLPHSTFFSFLFSKFPLIYPIMLSRNFHYFFCLLFCFSSSFFFVQITEYKTSTPSPVCCLPFVPNSFVILLFVFQSIYIDESGLLHCLRFSR
jgi:hypothetical protein